MHVPPAQTSLCLHAFPHPPQFAASLFVSTHATRVPRSTPHGVKPPWQLEAHAPLWHLLLPTAAAHCFPHALQLSGSLASVTHAPLQLA